MNELEAVKLARYVRALCPQQKFDEYTADAWGDVLARYDFEDCKAAAAELGQRQPFIAPAEIIAEVRKHRRTRLQNFQYEPEPGDDNPREYLRRLRAQIADVADGHRPAALPAGAGDAPAELLADVLADIVHPLDLEPEDGNQWN
jgi:hypothetical protein